MDDPEQPKEQSALDGVLVFWDPNPFTPEQVQAIEAEIPDGTRMRAVLQLGGRRLGFPQPLPLGTWILQAGIRRWGPVGDVIQPISNDPGALADRLLEEGAGRVQEAWMVAFKLLAKAWGHPDYEATPIADLVTAESLARWEQDFSGLNEDLQGFALTTRVRYLSPSWAIILLPRDESPTGGAYEVTREHAVQALAVFVRWSDPPGEWRVHLIGPPDTQVDELP